MRRKAKSIQAMRRGAQGRVLEDGTLMLFGYVGDDWMGFTAAEVVEDLHRLDNPDTLRVLINSPGGDVAEGLAIYHELATYPGKVEVEIVGIAASMASVIAMAGETIRIAERAHLMIHDPWNVAVGNAEEMRRAAELLDRFGTTLSQVYATRTGIDEDEIKELMARNDGDGTWFTAEQAVERGFADEVMEEEDDEAFAHIDLGKLKMAPAALVKTVKRARVNQDRAPVGADHNPPRRGGAEMDPKELEAKAKAEAQAKAEAEAKAAAEKAEAEKAAADAATRKERERGAAMRAVAKKHPDFPADKLEALISDGSSIEKLNDAILEFYVERQSAEGGPSPVPGGVTVTRDDADKWRDGATAWLIQRSGQARLIREHAAKTGEAINLDPGEFRGMTLYDLAREAVERAGGKTRGLSRMELAGAALNWRGARNVLPQHTTSDFPVLLENALHKLLRAAYELTPDTWRLFCATGSVMDFRPHPRLRMGSLGRLDKLLESGEIEAKYWGDAEKENVQAETYANIIGISRKAIVNDDLDGFVRIVSLLGRASALSIEVDVYALLATNGGLGPNLSDGNPLFHDRGDGQNNISTPAGAPGSATFDAGRVTLASMRDPSGNEILDTRPFAWVGPIGLGGAARATNEAEFNVDQVDPLATNRFMVPNTVRGLVSNIVDTARLSGDRWYMFANPALVPVIEVVFLEGQEAPTIEVEEGFDYDGVKWAVKHDYGVQPTDHRGAVTNAGA